MVLLSRNRLFIRVIGGLFSILIIYGIGTTLVILTNNDVLGSRMVQGFATMFAGILGFSSGYLLAYRNGDGEKDSEHESEQIQHEVERVNTPEEGYGG